SAVAGVSGFGFGGTNAHIVLREYLPAGSVAAAQDADAVDVGADARSAEGGENAAGASDGGQPAVEDAPVFAGTGGDTVLLAVSGPMPSRRRRAAAELADWMETAEGSRTPLADVGRTLARRNHGRSRAV